MCNKDLCRSTLSADRSTYNQSTCRPTVGRHVGRECRPTVVFITHDPCLQNGFMPLLCEMVVKPSASFIKFLLNFILRKIRFINLQFLISVQFVKFALKLIRMSLMAISVNGTESKKYWWFRNGKESP